MKNIVILLLVFVCFQNQAQTISLSFNAVPEKTSLFAENILSTSMNERDFAISPDGKEIYFTISTPKSTFQTIVYSRKIKEGQWTSPEVVSFAGEYSDLEPAFSADGNTMYFASNRPLEGKEPKDFDIWKVSRTSNSWGKPENLGSIINTKGDEFYPSITKSGNLYFTAAYKDGVGKEDIYVSAFTNQTYQTPTVLDTTVNSKVWEFNAFVSPDEKFILFTSYGRKDDSGGGDLYISLKDEKGKWGSARNLKELNSKQLDYCPYVSPDSKILFFTSERHQLPVSFPDKKATYQSIAESSRNPLNGTGNIYWINFQNLMTTMKQ
jgi:Tol biopolymer transport system component